MLADELDFVVGVDRHRDTHALAIVHAATGAALFEVQVAACERGYAQALRLSEHEAPGRRAWAIEGTGSYGAGLARFLTARGERVLEVGRARRERRSHAKSDPLDALRAARSVLGEAELASPRAAGEREALRALMVARAGALAAKKAGLCQLRALLVTCPEPLRGELRSLTRRGCSVAWRPCARTGTGTRSCAAR
jgi:transposase